MVFVKVSTDEGVSGWGSNPGGRSRTVDTRYMSSTTTARRRPLLIEEHWQVLTKSTFYRGGPVFGSAVAGIDQALWDIAGKHRMRRSTSCSVVRFATPAGLLVIGGDDPARGWGARGASASRRIAPR
jgi:hypothetical protein